MCHKQIYVCDLSGLSMSYIKPSWIKWLKPIFAQGSEYYPETLWRMYLVNAPWIVKKLWKIIKVWIDPETLEKIGIYGGPKVFHKAMQKDGIDTDILPEWLGGKGTAELVSLGNAEDYLRVASNVSTVLEMMLGHTHAVAIERVFTFGSSTMPVVAVALTSKTKVVSL